MRNILASQRRLTVLASLLIVTACGKPAFVDEACTRDTGTRVYVQEPAGDLAMPFKFDQWAVREGLLTIGARSIEFNQWTASQLNFIAEPGRYRARLITPLTEACRESLHELGYNAEEFGRRSGPLNGADAPTQAMLNACVEVERLGPPIEETYESGELAQRSWLAAFESPYILLPTSRADPRSEHLSVRATQIIRRSDAVVIAETVSLEWWPSGPHPATCYDEGSDANASFADRAFDLVQ